jgi:hypothetical protein
MAECDVDDCFVADERNKAQAEIARLNVSLANACEHHHAMGSELRDMNEQRDMLRAERDLLRKAICIWAVEHQFGHPDWKAHASNKALFDIARSYMGKE